MLAVGARVEEWEVVSVLGQGGMAVVYAVRGEDGGERALKVLHHVGPDAATRLRREAAIQTTLRHENVVAVEAVLEVEGRPAFVMERVPGRTLEDWLDEARRDEATVEAVFRGICAGVAHAHAQGVVHRDLKPSNVLLDESVDPPSPRIADFGVAKAHAESDDRLTRTGMGLGTPRYMAPEQIRDAARVDQRADVWALGCLLYELATGRRLFESTDPITLYQAAMARRWVPLREHRPDAPDAWVAALDAALQGRREVRAPDAATLLAVFDGAPWDPAAPAPDPAEQVGPAAESGRVGSALAALAALTALAALGVVWLRGERSEVLDDAWEVVPLGWDVREGRPATAALPSEWGARTNTMTHDGRRIWNVTLRGPYALFNVQRYVPGLGLDAAGFAARHTEVSGEALSDCRGLTLPLGPRAGAALSCTNPEGERRTFMVQDNEGDQILVLGPIDPADSDVMAILGGLYVVDDP